MDRREDHGPHRLWSLRRDRDGSPRPPSGVGLGDGLSVAAATGRLRTFDFSVDLTNQYTFWSGTIAALFLFCSYFGTDQSQVQRYLTARSVDEARHSLLMRRTGKSRSSSSCSSWGCSCSSSIVHATAAPLQRLTWHGSVPGSSAPAYAALEAEFATAAAARRAAATQLVTARKSGVAARVDAGRESVRQSEAALNEIRGRAATLARKNNGGRAFSDVNYITPTFILTPLPVGLVGLLILAIIRPPPIPSPASSTRCRPRP